MRRICYFNAVEGGIIYRSNRLQERFFSIDTLDQRILSCLQRDASMTNQALAETVGLSISACLKRVNRLRDSGVIDRVVALLNPEAIGQCLYLVVEVTMERDHRELYKRFETRILDASDITQCYPVTGESDFGLMLTVRDIDEYDRICNRVLYAEDNLKKFRTLLLRKRSKFDTATVLAPLQG